MPHAWPVARSSCSPRCSARPPSPAPPRAAAAAGNCVPASGWPADRADLAAQVVTLVNAHRAQLGLVALVVSPTLTATAEWKARNMAAYGYLDHDDPAPDARTADERLAACGYQSTEWGENIATGYATAQAVVDALAGLPRAPREHRAPGVPRHRRRRRGRADRTGRSPSAPWSTRAAWSPAPVACRRRRARGRRRALRHDGADRRGAPLGREAPPARDLRAARPRRRLPRPRPARHDGAHRPDAPRADVRPRPHAHRRATPSACVCTRCATCAPAATPSSSAPAPAAGGRERRMSLVLR